MAIPQNSQKTQPYLIGEEQPLPRAKADASRHSGRLLQAAAGNTPLPVTIAGWAVFVLLAIITAGQAFIGVDPQDEGQLLTYPWLIAHGAMPYRDIWMSYPPGAYLLLAGAFKIGIPGLIAERSLSLAVRFGYLIIVNRAATGSWRRFSWIATLGAGSMLFLSSGVRAYPWVLGALPFLLGLTDLEDRPARSAGWFLIASTMRFEFGLAGLIALVVRGIGGKYQRRFQGILPPLGLLAGLLCVFGTLIVATSGAAWQDIVVDPIFRVGAAHHLPLFPPYPGPLALTLELLLILGPISLTLTALKRGSVAIAAGNVALLSLLPQIYQRADWQHIFAVAFIAVPWLTVSAVRLQEGPLPLSRWSRAPLAWAGLVSVLCTLLVLSYGIYLSPLSPVPRESLWHSWAQRHLVSAGAATIIASSPLEAHDDRAVRSYLLRYASDQDHLFVAPRTLRYLIYNQTALYYVTQMRPAARYLEMLPGLEKRAEIQRQIVAGLRHTRWVVLWNGGYSWEPNSSVVPGSNLLLRTVRTRYRPVLRTPTYELLERASLH